MTLPVTLYDINQQISSLLNQYYDMIQNQSPKEDIDSILVEIESMKNLRDSFSTNSRYYTLMSQAQNSFTTAITSKSNLDIESAFQNFLNIQSYIKNNIIGFTPTGNPIFSSNSDTKYNEYGESVLIGDPEL